jgi:hypothetical protein
MSDGISVSELHELSASAIQALPRAMPIMSGDTVVGLLVPVRRPSPEAMSALFAEIDAAAARRTPEQNRELEVALGERELD